MKADRNKFFKEFTLQVCSSLDIQAALTKALTYLYQWMPADAMSLSFYELSKNRLISVAKAEREEGIIFQNRDVTEFHLPDDYVEFIKKEYTKPIGAEIFNRPEDLSEPVLKYFPAFNTCSTLNLRLKVHGQILGDCCVCASGLNQYTEEHAQLLESVKEPIAIAMSNARRYRELLSMKDMLADDNRALSADIKRAVGIEVVGADFGLKKVMEQVRLIAPSSSPALLLGETGTGKEVVANAIHTVSSRRDGPMISMQCGAVPDTLLDSELFGHEKGAFTGASERKRGRFERADGGTLFLDEIGELSMEAQVKLLRVLQESCFERVGGTKTIKVDVRIVAATHRDLEKMVRQGTFREDLWYRLNVLPIRIPPLRLRREDIPSLVQYFVKRKSQEMNLTNIPHIEPSTLTKLREYDWPGNVRELQNLVERALILSHGQYLEFPELVSSLQSPAKSASAPLNNEIISLDDAITRQIQITLDHTKGKISGKGGAAELLGMNESTLRFRMRKLGIKYAN